MTKTPDGDARFDKSSENTLQCFCLCTRADVAMYTSQRLRLCHSTMKRRNSVYGRPSATRITLLRSWIIVLQSKVVATTRATYAHCTRERDSQNTWLINMHELVDVASQEMSVLVVKLVPKESSTSIMCKYFGYEKRGREGVSRKTDLDLSNWNCHVARGNRINIGYMKHHGRLHDECTAQKASEVKG